MLVTCSDCNKQISSNADKCPFCGREDAGIQSVESKAFRAEQREKWLQVCTERCKEAIGKVVKMKNHDNDDNNNDFYRHYHGNRTSFWNILFRKQPEYIYFRITEIVCNPESDFLDAYFDALVGRRRETYIDYILKGEALCCGEKMSINSSVCRYMNSTLFSYLFEEGKCRGSLLWESEY